MYLSSRSFPAEHLSFRVFSRRTADGGKTPREKEYKIPKSKLKSSTSYLAVGLCSFFLVFCNRNHGGRYGRWSASASTPTSGFFYR